jgi:4-diphosphocytidyl-2-C-methyl-D-erythritol kinase
MPHPEMLLSETAYAKINLALHVRKRRDDGYHDLETLFAFVDAGDELNVETAQTDRLTISGEFSDGLTSGPGNLVLQALEKMRGLVWPGQPPIPPIAIALEKRLPVAAGIGGGSADAAAMIRLLDRHFLHNGDAKELILATHGLGADVGACIVSQTRIGTGLGWDLHVPISNDLTGTPVLLVNPRIALSTGPVFKAWEGKDFGPLPKGSARNIALAGRNDLEDPAIRLCPEISHVLAALRGTGAFLSRMSGSGATCFALFEDEMTRGTAEDMIKFAHPNWWTMSGRLR